MCVVVALAVLPLYGAGCGGGGGTPAAGSWLVLLCRASDVADEPHPKEWYANLFSKSEPELLHAYFNAVSNGTVDVSDSRVFGWFQMAVDKATLNGRNNTTRELTARDCMQAVTDSSADPKKYAGVITVINTSTDSGATGNAVVVQNLESPVAGPTFLEHEMLHALGLNDPLNGHSWKASADSSPDHVWDHGGDVEYQDCWDMMSAMTCVYRFPTRVGPQGPELQGEYRMKMGWMPANRIDFTSAGPSAGPRQVKLAPLSDPDKPGFLLARIEVPTRGFYVVEYREQSRFDNGIPSNAVVIREVRRNGVTFLVTRQNGGIGWRRGETFTDSGNFLSISVDAIVPGEATITINPAYSPGTAPVGSVCGDKFRGQVTTCAAGSTCRARQTGTLVSIDWFCLIP
jgi:hypothetical protein